MSNDVKVKPLFCGYLHSKKPANQRLIRSFSGWTNRLVTVLVDEIPSSSDNINVVKVFLGKKEFSLINKAKNINFNKRSPNRVFLNSNDCIIYRCKSRKEPHAFVLADRSRPLIYLAAKNEVICQHWMKTLRDALWPPDAQKAASKCKKTIYPVSLIDNEYSFQSNLIGIYGYLSFNYSHKLSLHNSQNGSVILDWPLNSISMRLVGESVEESFAVIENISLNNENVFTDLNSDWSSPFISEKSKALNEKNSSEYNLVLMSCSMNSTTGPGLIIFYTNEAVSLVDEFKSKKQKVLVELRVKQKNQYGNNYLVKNDLIKDELKEKFNSTLNKNSDVENPFENSIDSIKEQKKNENLSNESLYEKKNDQNLLIDVFDQQNNSDSSEEIVYQKEKNFDKKKVVFNDNDIVIENKGERINSILFRDDESLKSFENFDYNLTNKQDNGKENYDEKIVFRKKLPFYASADDLDDPFIIKNEPVKILGQNLKTSLTFESQNEFIADFENNSDDFIQNNLELDIQNNLTVNEQNNSKNNDENCLENDNTLETQKKNSKNNVEDDIKNMLEANIQNFDFEFKKKTEH